MNTLDAAATGPNHANFKLTKVISHNGEVSKCTKVTSLEKQPGTSTVIGYSPAYPQDIKNHKES